LPPLQGTNLPPWGLTNLFFRLAPPSVELSAATNEYARAFTNAGPLDGIFTASGTFRNVCAERPVEHHLWPPGGAALTNGVPLAFSISNTGDCPIIVTVYGATAREIVVNPGGTTTGTDPAARRVTVVCGFVGGFTCKVEYGFNW
jgi:hypothetical protein